MEAPPAPAPVRERRPRALTPGGVLVRHPPLLALVAAAFGLLAVAVAASDRGALVDLDDAAARRLVEGRGDVLDDVMRAVTELGGGPVVIPLALVCAAVVVRQAPLLAAAMVGAVALRYGLEDLAKEAIGRERPTASPLTEAGGFSFPSGHVLGATVGWGLVPAAVAVRTRRTGLWRASVVLWAAVTAGVAVSRAYLGVHWASDTVGSILLGLLILAVVDLVVGWAPGSVAPRGIRPAGGPRRRRPS